MSLFANLKRNLRVASSIRSEEMRIQNLNWTALEQHLKEYHNYYLENHVLFQTVMVIKEKQPDTFQVIKGLFNDNNFGLKLEQYTFGMLYHGWSVGVGLLDEQFPDERRELNEGLTFIRNGYSELLSNKGLDNKFVQDCFSKMLQQMFEIGREHGCKAEFMEFRPRRSIYVGK